MIVIKVGMFSGISRIDGILKSNAGTVNMS